MKSLTVKLECRQRDKMKSRSICATRIALRFVNVVVHILSPNGFWRIGFLIFELNNNTGVDVASYESDHDRTI